MRERHMRKRVATHVLIAILVLVTGAAGVVAQESEDALAAYRAGKYAEAVRICMVELESMPRNMNSYAVLGWSLVALGRFDEALESGLRGFSVSPRDPRIIEILGEAHYHLGNNLEALTYFEQYAVVASTGDRIEDVYYFMGEIFIRLEEYHHADIALATAVYHAPNLSAWWARLGYAREMAGDVRYALEAYESALALNSSLTEALRGRDRVRNAPPG